MWKKEEGASAGEPPVERAKEMKPARPAAKAGEAATIGPSITIKGDVSGDEDLLIQGRVDGSVSLEQQSVTVGREGRVKADITGRVLIVEGSVTGNLKADERVILRASARVEGDITAPRVVLEDGATFRGLVDMRDSSDTGSKVAARSEGATSSGTTSTSGVDRPTSTPPKSTPDKDKGKEKEASAASGLEKAAS
jgi:cytoskeletal protein CcmA (bactofilin family)